MFTPQIAQNFDCYVLYDMPGIEFKRHGDGVPRFFEPPRYYKDGLLALLDEGHPLVILHHACAAWPAWPEWAEIVGGQFLYQPMSSRGVARPDSGYRIDVPHRVSPVMQHPITEGVEPFEIVDELYLFEVFEDSVVPLFRSDFDFVAENFFSARLALAGQLNSREGWQHARGSNLVGWVKNYRNSPIVYLQFGDGPATFQNESFRRILANSIRWVCSPEARAWARERASRQSCG
ncbi:Trehalose utilization [compost metagenome]